MFFETSVKKRFVIKTRYVSDIRYRIGGGQNKVFRIIKPLLKKIFSNRHSDVLFKHIADVLLRKRYVFGKFTYVALIVIRRFCVIHNLSYPVGNRFTVHLRIIV